MYVKCVTAQFRCAIPSDGRITQAYSDLQELEADLEAWYIDQEDFAQRFEERIWNDTTPTFDLDPYTHAEQREEVIREADRRHKSIVVLHDELNQTINKATDHAARQLSTPSEPLTIVVKLNEQEEIEEVSKLTL